MSDFIETDESCITDMPTAIRQLLDAGVNLAEVKKVDDQDIYYGVVPKGCELTVKNLGKEIQDLKDKAKVAELGHPIRHQGNFMVADVDSFIAMVTRERIIGRTIVTANIDNQNFNGVINFARNGEVSGFGDRKIILDMKHTTEFKRWLTADRGRMTQLQLADFLEENLENISEPPAGEMIEMISNLKVKRNATYSSVVDVGTGEQSIAFQENIKGEMQNGSMDFRGKFKITLTPFLGSKPYSIDCNLRFSVDNERLLVFFSMINIEKVKEHAFEAESHKVGEAMVTLDIPVFNIR